MGRSSQMRTVTVEQRINVPFNYPVCFTRGLFAPGNPLLARVLRRAAAPRRLLVYIDDGVTAAHPSLAEEIRRYLAARPGLAVLAGDPVGVPGGERAKNGWQAVRQVLADIGRARLDRHSFIMAVGGGSVLDMVGFAASLAHRGLRLIRVPTTVLAQADAAVGVKNGMNEHGMKNFVGVFAPPFAVLCDFAFLNTLPQAHWVGGLSEAFKVALIKDARLFATLRRQASRLRARDEEAMARVVMRTARLHLDHIREGGDPFETGEARPLDFGHWAAHKLEMLSHHRLGHGQAVSVGIALDVCYAASQELLTGAACERILSAIEETGLPVWDETLAVSHAGGEPDVLEGIEEFREHLGGRLTLTLPNGIGRHVDVHEVDRPALCAAIGRLRERASCA